MYFANDRVTVKKVGINGAIYSLHSELNFAFLHVSSVQPIKVINDDSSLLVNAWFHHYQRQLNGRIRVMLPKLPTKTLHLLEHLQFLEHLTWQVATDYSCDSRDVTLSYHSWNKLDQTNQKIITDLGHGDSRRLSSLWFL